MAAWWLWRIRAILGAHQCEMRCQTCGQWFTKYGPAELAETYLLHLATEHTRDKST